jgi:hypothetical protein
MNLFTKALIVSVVVSCHLSLATANMIDEMSVDSVDTTYGGDPNHGGTGTLKIAQTGVAMLLEYSDNTQGAMIGLDFSLLTSLTSDLSSTAQTIADFNGGTITITKGTDVLLLANIGNFTIEEALNTNEYHLTGSGDFNVSSGLLASLFGPAGVLFDITWALTTPSGTTNPDPDFTIKNFSTGFTAESDTTLTPEPATMVLLAAGGLLSMGRRRRHNC